MKENISQRISLEIDLKNIFNLKTEIIIIIRTMGWWMGG